MSGLEHGGAWEGKRTPVVEVDLGETVMKFTYGNTWLIRFENHYQEDVDEQFSHMDYIVTRQPDGTCFINDSPDLMEQLDDLCFPQVRRPYPTPEDMDEYARYQMSQLDEEIDGLGQ